MGLLDIVKKLATGASDEDNRKNKARMREIFNSLVEGGDDYKLIYCHLENYNDVVVASITVHSNFIVGYKPGEVVVIQVSPDLTEHGEAEVFNKENGGQVAASWTGFCSVAKEGKMYQLEPITYSPGINRGAKYCVAVTQSQPFISFVKQASKERILKNIKQKSIGQDRHLHFCRCFFDFQISKELSLKKMRFEQITD